MVLRLHLQNLSGGGWQVHEGGKIHFKGNATIGRGTQIVVGKNATLEIGREFYCNANCIINAGSRINIGDECLIGWNVEILDGDGHKSMSEENKCKDYEPIEIKNHVWIGSHVMILKGVRIGENCVVAAKSCVTKPFDIKNIIIKDNNVIKEKIRWEK